MRRKNVVLLPKYVLPLYHTLSCTSFFVFFFLFFPLSLSGKRMVPHTLTPFAKGRVIVNMSHVASVSTANDVQQNNLKLILPLRTVGDGPHLG